MVNNTSNSIGLVSSGCSKIVADTSKCDKIGYQDEKYYCYFKLAGEKQDIAICNKIQIQQFKDTCIYWVNRTS